MTLIIEVSRPFQAKPGKYKSRVMTRVWWLWFSIARLHVPLDEFSRTAYRWEAK